MAVNPFSTVRKTDTPPSKSEDLYRANTPPTENVKANPFRPGPASATIDTEADHAPDATEVHDNATTEADTATDTATEKDQAPTSTEKGVAPRRGRLTDEQVEAIRVDWLYSRDLARTATDTDGWETQTDTEARLAAAYGTNRATVAKVVMGLSYVNAPGPIDVARRAAHDSLREMKERTGTTDRSPAAMIQYPTVVRLRVRDRAGNLLTQDWYPAGSTVEVATVDESESPLADMTADQAPTDTEKKKD